MDKAEKIELFKGIFEMLCKPTASFCLCRQIYAFELYKFMKEKHNIHPVALDMHDEMVRLGIAREIKIQLDSWDDPSINVEHPNEETVRMIMEVVEQNEREDNGRERVDVTKWAQELACDICL